MFSIWFYSVINKAKLSIADIVNFRDEFFIVKLFLVMQAFNDYGCIADGYYLFLLVNV